MTKVLLLSDTHSHIDQRILNYAQKADVIFHAGDIGEVKILKALENFAPLYAVYGNIDGQEIRSYCPKEIVVEIEKVKILMHHIGKYPPHYPPKIQEKIKEIKPKLYFCGHSHILKVIPDVKNHLIHMNPGACGKYGFHHIRTMLRFTIHQGKISNLEVIELGLRSSMKN